MKQMMRRTMRRRSVIGRQPPDHGPLRSLSLWIKCGHLHPALQYKISQTQ
jgi:hypothetical protein